MSDKSKVIHEIGKEILNAERLENEYWTSLALVITLTQGSFSQTGYLYLIDEIKPFIAKSEKPLALRHLSKELAEIIKEESKVDVVQILVQIRQSDLKIKIDFEYENRSRWSITPANMKEIKEDLRPAFD